MERVLSPVPRRRTVADMMTTRVHIAGPQTEFKLLVRLIEENRVSAIPVVDQMGVPIGIVSESDLLLKERRSEFASRDLVHVRRRRAQRAKADGRVASELMTSPAITVPPGATLAEAGRIMQESNVRRLVVVDDRGRIAGIVSRSDLLRVFLRSDDELRAEIVNLVLPAVLLVSARRPHVEVRSNVVTLSGQVDRRSDAEILVRLVGDVDGVVTVIDHTAYEWDDSVTTREPVLAVDKTRRTA